MLESPIACYEKGKTLSINHINGEMKRDRRTLSSQQLEKLEKALNSTIPWGKEGQDISEMSLRDTSFQIHH